MPNIKKKIFYFASFIITLILFMGIYKAVELIRNSVDLEREGKKTIPIIDEVWKGKCGSGYGYFAKFRFEVEGKVLHSTSSCIAPKDTKYGDKFYVVYLENDPTNNRILFDKKIGE